MTIENHVNQVCVAKSKSHYCNVAVTCTCFDMYCVHTKRMPPLRLCQTCSAHQRTHLAAVASVVVLRSWGVYRGGGGGGWEDVDDVGVHHFILLLQQVKDATDRV